MVALPSPEDALARAEEGAARLLVGQLRKDTSKLDRIGSKGEEGRGLVKAVKCADTEEKALRVCRVLARVPDLERGESFLASILQDCRALPPDDKRTRILPQGLMKTGVASHAIRTVSDTPDADRTAKPNLGLVQHDLSELPLLTIDSRGPHPGTYELNPASQLILADSACIPELRPHRGARLDKRLFYYGLLAIPINQRLPGERCEWRPTLKELRNLLWPSASEGQSAYRPSKHWEPLVTAFDAMSLMGVLQPDGCEWRPCHVWQIPNPRDLDSEAIIEFRFPPDSGHGPSIDHEGLIAEGMVSDPAFDLWINLHYLWDEGKRRNGGHRVWATRPKVRRNAEGYLVSKDGEVITNAGKPQRGWNHHRAIREGLERNPAADRIRQLDSEGIRKLAYGSASPASSSVRSQQKRKVKDILRRLELEGRVVLEKEGGLWRILDTAPLTYGCTTP